MRFFVSPFFLFFFALWCLLYTSYMPWDVLWASFFHIYMFYSDFTYQKKKKNDGNGGMLV